MFKCIYCRKSEQEVRPSGAHIFPDAVGGVASSSQTVCAECNGMINRCVESPVLPSFAVLNRNWGIRGRRGKIRGVKGEVEFAGKTAPVTFGEEGKPRHAAVIVVKMDNGMPGYFVFGPREELQEKCKEIETRHGPIQWHPIDLNTSPKLRRVLRLDTKPACVEMRRLAAKVAFERWAQSRGADVALDRQYDVVRNFIISGNEATPSSGLAVHPSILGMFSGCRPPQHSVGLFSHPSSRILGAIVSFYGLFYYWVLLSTSYTSLGPCDDLLVEDPVNRKSDTPRLRKKLVTPVLPWQVFQREFASDPSGIAEKAMEYARKRLNREA